MADVGRLRWILTADTRQFDASMRRTAGGIRRLAGIAATAFSAGRIGAFGSRMLNTVDSMAKLARAAGITVEQLQLLRHAGDLAGVSQDRLDDALLRFNKRLGEAQMGFGPLLRMMARYDQTAAVRLLRSGSSLEALGRMSRIIQQAPTPAAAAALTSGAFGTGNLRMVNLMRGGPAGLAAGMQSGIRNMALVSTDAARTFEELQDTVTRVQSNIRSTTLNATAEIVTSITGLVQRVDRFLLDLRERTLSERAAAAVGAVFNFVLPGFSRTTR